MILNGSSDNYKLQLKIKHKCTHISKWPHCTLLH